MGKRGVSPLIATVLLIGFVIVLAALIIKFGGELTSQKLGEVEFQQDRSILLDLEFDVTTIDVDADTIRFEVTNNEANSLDSFLVRVDGELVDCDEVSLPGFNTRTFECDLGANLDSCPSGAEFIPQLEINGELTSLTLSIQEDTEFSCGDEDLPESHLACVEMACQVVFEPGFDSCSSDSDCYFLGCVGDRCDKQEGTGPDTCFPEGFSCNVNQPKHLGCSDNNACIELSGEGENHKDCSNVDDPCDLPISECSIRDAYWSDTLGGINRGDFIVEDNTLVYPTVITKDCLDGETITLELCEDDGLFGGCNFDVDPAVDATFPNKLIIFGDKASSEWSAKWYDAGLFDNNPEYKFIVDNEKSPVLEVIQATETHLECDFSLAQCVEKPGSGDLDGCTFKGQVCGGPVGDAVYPRLQANIFATHYDSPFCRRALSIYSGITQGALWSSKYGGYDYGVFNGFGDHKDDSYSLGERTVDEQGMYQYAQETNPNLKVFSHRSLAKMESQDFNHGMTSPTRWLADSLSPRWFRYTPLMQVQEAVPADVNSLTFKFLKEDVQRIESWDRDYFPNGPGYSYWANTNNYDWYYLSFFDNDKGAGRGEFELLAIHHVTYDSTYAYVTVAQRENPNNPGTLTRTIFGTPQSYSLNHRAGIISSSAPNFGSLSFSMNRYCRRDLETSTNCDQTRVDGSNWIEAAAFYTTEFLMKATHQGTYLNDGVLLDADSQKEMGDFGFRFGDPSNYHLDENLDGRVDQEIDLFPEVANTYIDFAERVKNDAVNSGREEGSQNEFLVVINGYLDRTLSSHKPLNGKRYEDFNGGFHGNYNEALQQYRKSYTDSDYLDSPVISLISERDRCYYKNYAQYYCPEGYHYNPDLGVNSNNFDEHRNILAMTLTLGDGYYGHDYDHATGIPACALTPRDDWFDEFSVDPNGVSSKHPSYTAELLCDGQNCEKERFQYVGWLGKALGEGYELTDYPNVYRREFEQGITLFNLGSTQPITLEKPYKKILGVDPDNNGNLFNDGSTVISLTLDNLEGIVLLSI